MISICKGTLLKSKMTQSRGKGAFRPERPGAGREVDRRCTGAGREVHRSRTRGGPEPHGSGPDWNIKLRQFQELERSIFKGGTIISRSLIGSMNKN